VQIGDAIRAADNAAGVIDALLHEAKIDVVRIKELVSQMATGEAEADYIRRWTMVATLKGISNVLMLDGDDEWSQKTMNWTGLPDIARTLLTIMAGAADIPVTRLTGEQQTGLSGADAGSLRNYYDHIRSVQELEYTPTLTPLDEMVIRSALGSRPPKVWYRWNPLYTMDDKTRAEVDKIEAEAVKVYADTGLIPTDALAVMVQNRLVESGSWPGADTAYDAENAKLDILPVEEGEGTENEKRADPSVQDALSEVERDEIIARITKEARPEVIHRLWRYLSQGD
jgi:phage-related protein (TIGR01555 family)